MDYSLVISGQLRSQYLIPPEGKPLIEKPGGNLLYAAAGARQWVDRVQLLSRVGENFPHDWIKDFQRKGLDTAGVRILPGAMDLRSFICYTETGEIIRSNPVSHFVQLGIPFPKGLLGYQFQRNDQDNRNISNPDSPKLADIPSDFRVAKGVLLCPLDLLTHSQLAPAFRHSGVPVVCIEPGSGYMNGNFLNDLRSLLQGVTAFLPSEKEIRDLFWGKTNDLWEMASILGSYGCEIIVIKRGGHGQYVYEHSSGKRWDIPAYPSKIIDPTGAGNVFSGGFLAGYAETLDPLRAAMQGNISASLSIEGTGAFFSFDAMPGLARARLLSLENLIRKV